MHICTGESCGWCLSMQDGGRKRHIRLNASSAPVKLLANGDVLWPLVRLYDAHGGVGLGSK
jgi:hypothetical protein